MDDKDLFVTLEANIIEAVKRLVQNARNEFAARSSQGKAIAGAGAGAGAGGSKSPSSGGAARSTATTASSRARSAATTADPSKNMSKSLPESVTTAKKTVAAAEAAGGDGSTKKAAPAAAAADAAGTETATPKKAETKETDPSAPVVVEETPSESPALETSTSATGTAAGTEEGTPAAAAPAEDPISPEEEARRHFDELAMDVDGNLHSMRHVGSDRPKMSRRKTHAGSTNPKFDPSAPALPEPAIVALVPEPTDEERLRARVSSMAGPRMPMVNLGDLQKRGGRGGRGGGRGGGEAGGDTRQRGQTSVEGTPRPFNPRPLSELKLSSPGATASAEPSPKSPAAERAPAAERVLSSAEPKSEAAAPPAETAKPSDSAEAGSEPPALPQAPVAEEEAPPLPSLPASSAPLSPLWSPVQSPATDVGEPEHLSLDASPAGSAGSAPVLPSDPVPHAKAQPKAPPRSPVPGPAPPPGHNPHHSPSPSSHHHGPAPPPARVMSPPPGARKVSTVDRAPSQLELQDGGEGAPPVPSSPLPEGDGGEEPAQKSLSSVMNVARARQPMINLADITKPRTPKGDGGKPAGAPPAPQAATATVPKCDCGCTKFVMNPFKKGTNCSTCFHPHPSS